MSASADTGAVSHSTPADQEDGLALSMRGSWIGATEQRYLVPQREELKVLGGGRAAHQ
jgi:hypothetical protein